MNIHFTQFSEGPIAALMRLQRMSLTESRNDFKKRQVTVEIFFLSKQQRWQMTFMKNQKSIFQKTFSKTCRSEITHWFRTYDLEHDKEHSVKIPWKALERGEKWVVEAYVNRRYWSFLELPPELSLCQIIKLPLHRKPRPYRNFTDWDNMGKIIHLPIVKKRLRKT